MIQHWRVQALAVFLFWLQLAHGQDQAVLSENTGRSHETLLWGPYRPNLYFGVRPRIPKSLTTGLLWAKVDSFQDVQSSGLQFLQSKTYAGAKAEIKTDFRHTCEQNEGMAGYGWDEYDVRTGGRQTIHDAGNMIDITTEFVKIPGGQHGGSWGVRIRGTPRDNAPEHLVTSMIFYAAMEGFGNLQVSNEEDELGIEGTVKMEGSSNELGGFTLEVTEGPESNVHPPPRHKSYDSKPLDRSIVSSLQVEDANIWQAKGTLPLGHPLGNTERASREPS